MELKESELRLDNWIYDKINNRHVSCHGIDSSHNFIWVNYANGSSIYTRGFDEVTPIELSEEILLKCGFEKREEVVSSNFLTFGFGDNPITRDWIIAIKYFKDENKFFYNNGFHTIKHLHQIQNLYFALTQTELEINL